MAGFDNDCVYANNADFSTAGAAGGSAANGLQTDGQIWIGSTATNAGGTHVNVGKITSPLGTLSVGFSAGNITLDLIGGGVAVDTLNTDVSGPVSPSASGVISFTGATNIFSDGSVANTMRLNLQGTNHAIFVGRGANTASASLGVGTNGQVLLAATGADPAFGTVATNANMNTVVGANSLTLNPYNCAKWIVDATANIGTHQTIAAALTAASSGDTIFIRPGTYTENLTLKAGVHLTAFLGDDLTPNVTIVGKATATFAGTCTISNIKLQTNSDNFLAVTGSNNTVVNVSGCTLLVANAVAGLSYTTSGASASVNFLNCQGDVSSATGWMFTSTAVGNLNFRYCRITNTGAGAVLNTTSSTIFEMTYCWFIGNFQLTNPTGGSAFRFCRLAGSTSYTIETVTSGSLNIEECFVQNTSTGCVTIGAGSTVNVTNSNMSCISSNAIVGAGSLAMDPMSYGNNQGQSITATTITDQPFGRTGSFTPALAFGGSSTGITYNSRTGTYWVIGKMVFIYFNISLSSKGAQTGNATVTGLPVTAAAGADQTMEVLYAGSTTYPASCTSPLATIGGSGTTVTLWGQGSGAFSNMTNTQFTNSSTVQMSGFYWSA